MTQGINVEGKLEGRELTARRNQTPLSLPQWTRAFARRKDLLPKFSIVAPRLIASDVEFGFLHDAVSIVEDVVQKPVNH